MTADQAPLSAAERDELARFRLADARRRTGRGRRAGRWVGAVALLVVVALLAIVSVLAVFVRNQLLDTDRYVATMAPLARDPAVQKAIANRLTTEIVTRVDLDRLGGQASAWLRKQGAPPAVDSLVAPAVSGVESFLHAKILAIVRSDTFATAWDQANRAAHKNLDAVLTGSRSGVLRSSGTTVSVDLGALLMTVKHRLVHHGFALANRIPRVNVEFTLFSSKDLPKLRGWVTILDTAATWLPWAMLVLLVAAVVVAPDHRRGALLAGAFTAIGTLVVLAAVAIVRTWYLNHLPPQVQSPEAVARAFDTVLARVLAAYWVIVAVGAVIAVVAWFGGPARPATWTRGTVARGLDLAGAGLSRTGVPLGGAPAVLRRYHVAIDLALVALALIGFLLTGVGVGSAVGFGIALVVAIVIVETIARTRPAALATAAAERSG
jgi:hypothetical protein